MKIERTKNATRNIIFGIVLKIYQSAVPFIMRSVIIYFLGVKYLGLNSLFTSILQVLNLAELGVGSAMSFSMYKPIAEDDTKSICALMRLYMIYYRVIGAVICVLGMILLPFVPQLIHDEVPEGTSVYILYLMNLMATVLTYWLFAYKNSVINAHQRNDVTSKIVLITDTIKYALQIFVLVVFRNYYYFVIVILATQVINNIVTAIVSDKMYPEYNPKGKLPDKKIKEINQRIRDLFTSKLGTVIVNSADTIVISTFLGLTSLAIYQNYFYLLTAVREFIRVAFSACTAGIGNSMIVETKEKNYSDLKKFTFIIAWIAGVCTVCFLCLFQPFMELWMGKDLMVSFSIVVCFCIYFFVMEINSLINLYKDAAGMWHEDRFRPLVTALTNLGLNLIMVQFWGLYGIILSTVLSTVLVGMPWLLQNLFTVLFERSKLFEYLRRLFIYVIITLIAGIATYLLCTLIKLPLILTIICRGVICALIPNIVFYAAYRRTNEYMQSLQLLNRMAKGKLAFLLSTVPGEKYEKNNK